MKSLKIACLALVAVFMFTNSTCKKKIRLEKSINSKSIDFIALPQAAGTFTFSKTQDLDIDALLKDYDLSLTNVMSIQPESLVITIEDTTATPVTYDIVDNVILNMGTNTIPMKKVAWKDPMPKGGLTSVSPDVDTNIDILELAKANTISYDFTGKLNTALNHQVKMKATFTWKVVGEL